MNRNKKYLVIAILILVIITVSATYAYFQAQGGGSKETDVDVITGTTDLLSFSFGDEIYINANESNFAEGMENLSDSTTGTALLRANNATNSATATYNIYLIIEANDFEYTTDNQTPELLLNVTDPNGNLVENITGLVHYEDGFDITTRTGGFLLVPDYEITASAIETIQDWNIEITFVNLESNQNANAGKTLTGKLYMTREQMSSYELTEINNIKITTTYDSIDATLDITNGSASVNKYYYAIEEGASTMAYVNNTSSLKKLSNTLASIEDVEFVESTEANYEFNNLKENTEYTIYSYVEDENKIKSNVYETKVTTGIFEPPVVNSITHSSTLNSISLTVTATPGSNEIVKYMYSKDNGLSWEESESNTYTFSNLTDTTEYKIKVKVADSKGNESTEYYAAITTEIYILPVVSNVEAATTWNSITLTPSGTNGTNTIDHYEYSINDGAYQESNVFDNLNEQTNYTINVKAIDNIGRESNVYLLQVRTDEYVLPTISVNATSTYNSITINVNATPGDGSIVSYHYSRDDGSNYQTSNSNTYTFNELTPDTTYYLEVYVTDSNGRTSSTYSVSLATVPKTLADTCREENSNTLACHVATTYTIDGENGIYYHDGVGNYTNVNQEAGDNSYRYAGGDYELTEKAISEGYTKVYALNTNVNYKLIKFYCNGEDYRFGDICSNSQEHYYTTAYNEATHYDTLEAALTQAVTDGYLTADNIKNFVCFGPGASEGSCSEDNLYRIIGVFNGQVKLIKYDYADTTMLGTDGDYNTTQTSRFYSGMRKDNGTQYRYYWGDNNEIVSAEMWNNSSLNKINLNTNYWNYLQPQWQNKIANTTWKNGSILSSDVLNQNVKYIYQKELAELENGSIYQGEIGLMYISDYLYAVTSEVWSAVSNWYSVELDRNWMYMGDYEWTITQISNIEISSQHAFIIDFLGYIYSNGSITSAGVRPVFYLNSDVSYVSGDGSINNPYRIL